MSLHLGNLSPRIRRDELERVFRRFGRCTVQLKDGYGFAVYDFRGDAEKALRSLKGRKICGEPIYLSWSNKQPKPLQRFARAVRSHDMQYDKNSDKGDNYDRRNVTRSRGEYSMSDKHQDNGGGKHMSTDVRDDSGSFNHKRSGPAQYNKKEELLEGHAELNQIDDSRWVDQADNLQNGHDLDGQMTFDRYEPDYGEEGGGDYENHGSEHLAGSPSRVMTLDKNRRVRHSDNRRGHQVCFKCRAAGHKMRDCPLEDTFQKKRSKHSDHRQGNELNTRSRGRDEDDFGGPEYRSIGRLQPNGRSSGSARRPEMHRRSSHAEKVGVIGRTSPVASESTKKKRNDCNRKRRRERENQNLQTNEDKKSRALPLLRSDHTSPQLGAYSRSLKSLPGSRSCSRSQSLIPHSRSTSSFSESRANRSRYRSIKSISRSRSRSPSSSSSISLGQSLPSPPNNAEVTLYGSSNGVQSPEPKEVPVEARQLCEEVREKNLYVANRTEAGFSGRTEKTTNHQFKEVSAEKQLELDSEDSAPTSTTCKELGVNAISEDDHIPRSQDVTLEEKGLLEPEFPQNIEPLKTDLSVRSEDVSSSGNVEDDVKMDQLHNEGDVDYIVPPASCEMEGPYASLLQQDDKDVTVKKVAAEKLRENEELQDASDLEMTGSLKPVNNSELKAPVKLHVRSRLSISTEELCRVLKHYGLNHSEDIEQPLDSEDYFGSARLWPWEMIYYRRLKKGPISMENYARRVAQNEAFGITDKYIRSSSGWNESIEENT